MPNRMVPRLTKFLLGFAIGAAPIASSGAQQPAAAPPAPPTPEVGTMAPDFTVAGYR